MLWFLIFYWIFSALFMIGIAHRHDDLMEDFWLIILFAGLVFPYTLGVGLDEIVHKK